MEQKSTPQIRFIAVEELELGIKSRSKRERVISLLEFLIQHQGSFISKRRLTAYLGVNQRSLFRYLHTLKNIVPIEKKFGMYGLRNIA